VAPDASVRRALAPLASAEWARDGIELCTADARDARVAEPLNGANILASLGLRSAPLRRVRATGATQLGGVAHLVLIGQTKNWRE